ncbi:MAG: response regulator [Oceanipulchritudo sp.]
MNSKDKPTRFRFLPGLFPRAQSSDLNGGSHGGPSGKELALCLDDDPLSLRLVEHLLKKRYKVISCLNLDRAVVAVRRERIGLFLCDYHLGQEFTGAQAYDHLRLEHGYNPLHRVLITSYPSNEIEAESLASGFDRVFAKPLRKEFQSYCMELRGSRFDQGLRTG